MKLKLKKIGIIKEAEIKIDGLDNETVLIFVFQMDIQK